MLASMVVVTQPDSVTLPFAWVELQQGCICFCSVSVTYIKNPFTEPYALKRLQKNYDMIIVYPISIPYCNKNGSDM